MAFDLGEPVTLTFVTTAEGTGVATDPTSVTVRITSPAGVVTVQSGTVAAPGQLTRPIVGTWKYKYYPTTTGSHAYKWWGTGALEVAEEGSFEVKQTAYPGILS